MVDSSLPQRYELIYRAYTVSGGRKVVSRDVTVVWGLWRTKVHILRFLKIPTTQVAYSGVNSRVPAFEFQVPLRSLNTPRGV